MELRLVSTIGYCSASFHCHDFYWLLDPLINLTPLAQASGTGTTSSVSLFYSADRKKSSAANRNDCGVNQSKALHIDASLCTCFSCQQRCTKLAKQEPQQESYMDECLHLQLCSSNLIIKEENLFLNLSP